MNSTPKIPFVSCDWGTTNFRLRLVGTDRAGREVCTEEGTAKIAAAASTPADRAASFRSILQRGLEQLECPAEWPVLISGMASSSIGWKELPYAKLPFALDGRDAICEQVEPHVHLISGVRSDTDVLRGEETQTLGLAASLADELPPRALFVFPGTHSKHVEIETGRIVRFRTYMTGELFDVLTRHSVLRHSTDPTAAWDHAAFVEGVESAQGPPLSAALFRVRTRQVLDRCDVPSNTSFLSGLLIGAELAAVKTFDSSVLLASQGRLVTLYTAAGETLRFGAKLRIVDSDSLAALGQEVLSRRIMTKESK